MKKNFQRLSMSIVLMMPALFAFGQSAWVDTEIQLLHAIEDGQKSIKLDADIQLSKYLDIDGRTFTLDLNGHKLSRSLDSHGSAGHVIWAHNGCNLTLTSSIDGGSIEGGKANNGGAIHIPHGNKVTANNVIFQNNSAADHAGAIWNNGTFEATNCTFKNNTANDVGAIYNAVTSDGAGNSTLTGCTFTGNKGTAGAGALANALGNTVMTIDGCTITGNTANSNGAGIWNGGTLNMKGVVTVTDNKNGDVPSNVYLKSGKVITVTGKLTGSNICVNLEDFTGKFTSGYKTYNNGVEPKTFFTADFPDVFILELDSKGEACLTLTYIERSWNATNKQVVSTWKTITGDKIAYSSSPGEGQYKVVTNAPDNAPNEWFQMGGYNNKYAEYYVVLGNVKRETIVVMGKNVHLILLNGATLTLTGGLILEDDHKLYIHSQSYGSNMGRLMVTNKYEKAAGIGSAQHEGKNMKAGALVIYGGHIEANGGEDAAGIGSCARSDDDDDGLCNSVTIFGGYVKATGGDNGAGIGGGDAYHNVGVSGGVFVLYDGTVIAQGGKNAAGVGGGGNSSFLYSDGGSGANVTVYGGTLTATGGKKGAGIGGGCNGGGSTIHINGGTVTANGGQYGAGIGGGSAGNGAEMEINGGTVTAYGGTDAAGIGGGEDGSGYKVIINGGTVYAYGNGDGAGIGGGENGGSGILDLRWGKVIAKAGNQGGTENRAIGPGKGNSNFSNLLIGEGLMVGAGDNGSVERIVFKDERVQACWYRSYAEISPCTHPHSTYIVNGKNANGTHTKFCAHCSTKFEAERHNFDMNNECIVCHLKGNTYTVTIYVPDANDDDTYTTDGVYKSYTYEMVAGTSFTLPGAPQDLQDMMFAGWLITTEGAPSFSSYRATAMETLYLYSPGRTYTLTENCYITARYKDINISLADNGDNYETIYNFDGKVASSVTLTGRTFYKDGNWNTLCLPFAVNDGDEADNVTFSGTPLEGATVLTLDNATFERNTLTLNFQETTAMEPGKPYLIKWAEDTEHPTIASPVFNNVVISNVSTTEMAVVAGFVSFKGQYAPLNIGEDGDTNILYLGDDNTFRYSDGAMDINSFRAYFDANTSLGDVNGDGNINVTDVTLMVDYILGQETDESFRFENADITLDGIISVTDVTALTDIILGGNSILKVVVNGADGLSFSGGGSGPARISK